jgi:signal transduction histidine kinase
LSDSETTKSKDRIPQEPFIEADAFEADEATFPREGLPPDYRMRHDEHYVDELIAAGRMPQLRLVAVGQISSGVANAAGLEDIDSLVDSIQEFGVLQPLLVRRDRGRYELLSGAKRLAAASAAGLREVPCLVLEVDELEARRLAEAANRSAAAKPRVGLSRYPWSSSSASLVEGSLHTILSTLGLLERPESSLRDQVALGLIRAESLKASRHLHGLRILSADPPVHRRMVDLAALVDDVLHETDDERALLAIELDFDVEEASALRVDRELLALAISGAIEGILSLLRKSRGSKLHVRLSRTPLTRETNLFVWEDAVRMPTSSWSRWFDLDWDKRPGGHATAVALLAARRAAELHGGRIELKPTESGGVRLGLTLPEGN